MPSSNLQLKVLLLLTLILAPTTHCSAQPSRYYIIPNSRSPKGTYLLAFALKNDKKVEWNRLSWAMDFDYRSETVGGENENVECHILRRADMSRVKRVPVMPFYRTLHYYNAPEIVWTKSEDAFFFSMDGYWAIVCSDVVWLSHPVGTDHADISPLLTKGIDLLRQRNSTKFKRRHGLGYRTTFGLIRVTYTTKHRLSITVGLYVPKGSSDWGATARINLKLSKSNSKLKATLQSARLLSVKPDSTDN